MKTKLFSIVVIMAVLAALFPTIATAAAPTPITIHIHHQTGGQVQLSLALPNGSPIFKSIDPGVSSVEVENGVYSYYAQTVCGPRAGSWNLGVTKSLYINCKDDLPFLALVRPDQKIRCDLGLYEIYGPPLNLSFFDPWKYDEAWLIGRVQEFGGQAQTLEDVYIAFANRWPNITFAIGCYDGVSIYDVR